MTVVAAPPTAARPTGGSPLTGTGELLRLAVRRDRLRLPAWLLVLVALPAVTPGSFAELFPTDAARAAYAGGVTANPSLRALQGPVFGDSLGALTAARTLTLTAVLAALLAALTVVRHTRAEEEAGRRELVSAGTVGRQAGLAAALLLAAGTDALLAVGVAGALVAAGLPLAGSVAAGLAIGGAGLVFAGVAALAAQLAGTARGASGIAFTALGAAFLLRAAGDAGAAEWPSWLSPLGWVARVRPFTGERWWVLAVPAAAAAATGAAALVLSARRDLGAGVLPARPGAGAASPALAGPSGLAWRLHRTALLGWTLAFALAGAAFGGIAGSIDDLVGSSPETVDVLRRLGGGGALSEAFLAAEFGVLGALASAYAVAAVLRLRAEEVSGRAEAVLATAVGRGRWGASHLLVAVVGPALLLTAAGLAAGAVRGGAPRLVGAALLQLPAVWVFAGAALALVGLLPRLATAAWGVLAVLLLFGQFGAVLRLPQWVLDLSPFTHLPRSLADAVAVAPLLVMTAVGALLAAAGLAGLRRRDVG